MSPATREQVRQSRRSVRAVDERRGVLVCAGELLVTVESVDLARPWMPHRMLGTAVADTFGWSVLAVGDRPWQRVRARSKPLATRLLVSRVVQTLCVAEVTP